MKTPNNKTGWHFKMLGSNPLSFGRYVKVLRNSRHLNYPPPPPKKRLSRPAKPLSHYVGTHGPLSAMQCAAVSTQRSLRTAPPQRYTGLSPSGAHLRMAIQGKSFSLCTGSPPTIRPGENSDSPHCGWFRNLAAGGAVVGGRSAQHWGR